MWDGDHIGSILLPKEVGSSNGQTVPEEAGVNHKVLPDNRDLWYYGVPSRGLLFLTRLYAFCGQGLSVSSSKPFPGTDQGSTKTSWLTSWIDWKWVVQMGLETSQGCPPILSPGRGTWADSNWWRPLTLRLQGSDYSIPRREIDS